MMLAAMPRRLIVSASVFVMLAAPALAQIDRGQISGSVKDETGLVIPGATVTATNVDTGIARTAVTDATGYYVFTSLAPAVYDVEAELQGFKKFVKKGVRLDASASVSVDVTLPTGAISESITVIAQSTPLQTDVALRKTV